MSTHRRLTRPVGSLLALLGLVGLLASLLLAVAPTASASTARDDVPAPPPGAPWFGPGLDWTQDAAEDYRDRLGETPSLYAQRVHYPLTDDDALYLRQFAEQSAQQGAVALVSLEPQVALTDLTEADADRLAEELEEIHRELGVVLLIRFAPEMNGSWVTWGQQPTEYVEAFRTVAAAVDDATPFAQMVWAPAYGAGYPFGGAFGAVEPSEELTTSDLDTDGDGVVDERDDPYGPYYPGDDVVDWVGLSLYHFGEQQEFGANVVPDPDSFQSRLDEQWGYGDDRRREPFYDRFAEATDTPMVVETAALYNPAEDGDELELKRAWWRQVFAADADHPLIGAISWLELERPEAEAGDQLVDWRATADSDVADALAADLRADGLTLGPVTRIVDLDEGNVATAQGRQPAPDEIGDAMGWIVLCVAFAAVLWLLAGLAGRWIPQWRYPRENDPRDERLDLLRGFIIIAVVVTHIELGGPWTYVTLNAIGAITGAELFVLLSGVVLGMIYEPTVRKLGEWRTAVTMWKRARKQYVVALVVVVLVYVLGRIPFIDSSAISTFTDRGTGEEGSAAAGTVYDLYANAARLFDYPPPWYAVKQLLLLEMGPWVFNIMGLFVVLSLLLPPMMWLVRRGLWWLLLAISWAVFVYAAFTEPRVLPSQFDAVFPLLTWQVAFTHGLVVGRYRAGITRALTSRPGKAVTTLLLVGYAAVLGWIWAAHRGLVGSPFPDDSYAWLAENFYVRVFLQPGRLIDLAVVLVVAYAVFTTMWKPINAAVGRFWIPLGQASLYVFIVHVFFALAVANIPGLDRASWWQGLLIHSAVLAVIWVMVTRKFLFSVIPR